MFNLTASDLFIRDVLLQGAPEGVYRVTRSIITLIMRAGEGALAAVRAAGSRFDSPRSRIARMGYDQRPRRHLHPTARHCSTPCRQTQGSESLDPAEPLSDCRSIQQPG